MSEIQNSKFNEDDEKSIPRDGMSAQSAIFQIGKYANSSEYSVDAVENMGRYFTAKVLNKSGNVVNEIIVDKLNGRVKFLK
jgi:hypothetical protein